MHARYTDFDTTQNGAQDFIVRKRKPSAVSLSLIILIALTAAIATVVVVTHQYTAAVLIALIAIGVGWHVILQIQRNNDTLLATEFQNALFASALGLNNKFCMIMKHDGSIVYLDRSFQSMFPDFISQSRRSLDALLELGKVSEEDRGKIYAAISGGVYEKVIFDIKGAGSDMHKIIMSIEPILRPKGFVLLRGREFVESRIASKDADNHNPALLGKPTITLFSHVMDTMHMGIYMTGPSGIIIYANPLLERWLGYREGEITSLNLAINNLFQQKDKTSGGVIVPDDFEGELMMQKKTEGSMKVFVNQKIIKDDNGKLLGCTAIVHSYADGNPDIKKKLW